MNAPFVQPSAPVKRTFVAYLLWFFFGGIGAHKFYLGRPALGLLYICMFVAFWYGVLSLSAAVVGSAIDTINLSLEQANHTSPVHQPRLGRPSISYSLMIMTLPLSLALLYDLFTIPAQVRAANVRLGADGQQTFGALSAGSTFDGTDQEAELAAKKADELVARYIARQSQSSPPARAARGPQAGAPTFGRRGR